MSPSTPSPPSGESPTAPSLSSGHIPCSGDCLHSGDTLCPDNILCPGDILLFGRARLANLLITLFSRSPYYHVGIYAGDGQVIEMRVRGLVQRDLRSHDGARYFLVIPAPNGTGKAALDWAISQKGARYAMSDIIVIALDKLFPHWRLKYPPGNTYTCGEFVAVAFDQAGVRLLPDVELSNTEPGDYAHLVASGAQPKTFEEHQGCEEDGKCVLESRVAVEQEQPV